MQKFPIHFQSRRCNGPGRSRMTTQPTQLEDPDERAERLRLRLKAARLIAGFRTVGDLAQRIEEQGAGRGYSASNLGLMESGGRIVQTKDLPVLAAACGVAPAFFTVDFATLTDTPPDDEVRRRLDQLEAQQTEDSVRLAQLEEAVRALTATDRRDAGEGGAPR